MSENPESQEKPVERSAGAEPIAGSASTDSAAPQAQPLQPRLKRLNDWFQEHAALWVVAGLVLLTWQTCETRRSTNAALASLEFAKEEAKSGEAETRAALEAANRSARAMEQNASAMAASVAILQRQADLAERSFRTTERSIRDRERAWVVFEGPTPQPASWSLGDESLVTIRVKNVGTLPAMRVLVQSKTVEAAALPPTLDWKSPQFQSATTLGAGMSIEQQPSIYRLSAQRVENIKAGRLNLYLIARVTYLDQLGNQHETKLCQYLDPEKKTWLFCDHHNDIN